MELEAQDPACVAQMEVKNCCEDGWRETFEMTLPQRSLVRSVT